MRNLKKFLALVLAMMMTLSLLVVANAAPATPTDFTDLDKVSPAYAEAVNVLSALKIIKGDDGFRPGETITRAEVSMILYRVAHNDADESQVKIYKDYDVFPDVQSDKWYAGSVNYCANAGYLKGYPNGSFGPSNEVTGYEVLVMTLRMLGYGKNGEFEGKQGDWRLQAAMYGRKAGLTKQIKEGTLGQPATREMVAEIMFQALQADLVDYNLLQNYYPSNVLIADNEDNRKAYANAIAAGLTLPLNGNLMYVNYGIVGKTAGTPDPFGRPTVAWVTDNDGDTAADSLGRSSKYIVNVDPDTDNDQDWGTGANNIGFAGSDVERLSIALTPVATYDNAIDECHLTKDVNNDTSIFWNAITEIVNGEVLNTRAGNGKLDALHTTTKWIGATGRTTEIYKLDEKIGINSTTGAVGTIGNPGIVAVNKWRFVYIDTFLGEVTSVVEEVKDTAGHTIIEPTATVEVGNKIANATQNGAGTPGADTDKPAKISLKNPGGKYKVGDLVLVQTPNGGKWANDAAKAAGIATPTPVFITGTSGPNDVTNPEKAPLNPEDVPNSYAHFAGTQSTVKPQLLPTGATTVKNVTIKATLGAQDAKMGVIASDGTTYMASNTFLASRSNDNTLGYGDDTKSYAVTVLPQWYDVDPQATTGNIGITNSMIGRTYDLVLDHHGYIIGLKEVLAINEGVGVITSIDSVRVGGGKYVTEVEAYMTDGSTKTFQLLNKSAAAVAKHLNDIEDKEYDYFSSVSDADNAWKADGFYTCPNDGTTELLGIGSLVQFKTLSFDGKTYNKIVDWSNGTATTGAIDNSFALGYVDADGAVKTGVTNTVDNDSSANTALVNDDSVVFVAEYEYRYNTSGNNDGSNINKTYKVYEGFKKMPSIKGAVTDATHTNVLYQQLGTQVDGNEKYVLVYAKDAANEYIIKAQDKITVDESYLILSRGATYAEYSEYNTLRNGEPYVLQVSNANKNVNALIEATMDDTITCGNSSCSGANATAHFNSLILVTGRNVKGYVTSVTTVNMASGADATSAGHHNVTTDSNITLNVGGRTGALTGEIIPASADVDYEAGVLTCTNTAGDYLTLDDNVKVQLVNRDQKTVTEISLDVAMVYAHGKDGMTAKPMVFELNELGYICNLYVIE